MSLVDIAIVAVILISLSVGISRGFVREILSLASWVVALWAAYVYVGVGEALLAPYIAPPPLRAVASFVVIFVLALIVASLLGRLLIRLQPLGGISGLNRLLGMLFGIARGVVIVALLLLLAIFLELPSQSWWQESLLAHYFTPVADGLRELMSQDFAVYFQPKIEPL